MDKFNIEKLWNDYLKRMQLDPKKMSSVQYSESKRAFFGGASSIFLSMSVDMPALNDDQAEEAMDLVHQQLKNFWQSEIESRQTIRELWARCRRNRNQSKNN